jgi:hypothetical protein
MEKSRSVILKGVKATATRTEVQKAKSEFESLCNKDKINKEKSRMIREAVKYLDSSNRIYKYPSIGVDKYGLELNPIHGIPVDVIEAEAFKYALNWINDMLSPTYVHEDYNRKKLPKYVKSDDRKYIACNGHEIVNQFTPEKALDFVLHFFSIREKKINQVVKAYYEYD